MGTTSDLGVWIESLPEILEEKHRAPRLIREFQNFVETGGHCGDREALRASARTVRAKWAFEWVEKSRERLKTLRQLSQAVFAISKLKMPEARARSLYRAKPSEVAAVRKLAALTGKPFGAYASNIPAEQTPAWIRDVLRAHVEVDVLVTQAALQDLLFVAAEGYRVPRARSRRRGPGFWNEFTEVYGLCFGTVTDEPQERPWKVRRVFYTVERCIPQLRAEMRPESVSWNLESTRVQVEAARRLSPQWRLLGDFHSHPYRNVEQMRRVGGWGFSEEDEAVNERFVSELRTLKQRPVIGLVVAVAKKGRARVGRDVHAHGPNTARFTFGRYEYVLGAWVNPVDHTYSPANRLTCHGVGG